MHKNKTNRWNKKGKGRTRKQTKKDKHRKKD